MAFIGFADGTARCVASGPIQLRSATMTAKTTIGRPTCAESNAHCLNEFLVVLDDRALVWRKSPEPAVRSARKISPSIEFSSSITLSSKAGASYMTK